MDRTKKVFKRFSVIVFSGHFLSGLIILSFHKVQEILKDLPFPLIIAIVIIYFLILGIIWFLNESKNLSDEEKAWTAAAAMEIEERIKRRQHYTLLEGTLDSLNQAVQNRIIAMHEANNLLSRVITSGNAKKNEITDIIKISEGEKREHINSLFRDFCNTFKADTFLATEDPDKISDDVFKVSFYRVDESDHSLKPAYRAYPHDSIPQTCEIPYGEAGGGAGLAWKYAKIIVMEDVANDQRWVDFRPGQRREYASMICLPVVKDIPKEPLRKVIGVLTVDSRIRKGFFSNNLETFWQSLSFPVCNFLILITENENRNKLLIQAIENIC